MNKITKWVGLGFLSLLTILSISVFRPSQKALAATPTTDAEIVALKSVAQTGVLVNMAFITMDIGGVTYIFKDSKPYDGVHQYNLTDSECYGRIEFDYNKPGPIVDTANSSRAGTATLNGATLDLDYLPPNTKAPGGCKDASTGNFPIGLAATGNNVWFEYLDSSTILDLEGNAYKPSTTAGVDAKLWVKDGDSSCANLMIVNGDSLRLYKLMESNTRQRGYGIDKVDPESSAILSPLFPDSCSISTIAPWSGTDDIFKDGKLIVLNLPIGNRQTNNLPAGEGGVPGDLNDGAIGADCYTGLKNGFSWLVCPTLGFIDDFIDWAEEAISKQLTVDLGPQDTRDKLQESWRIVARFSSGILVAIALVMVIATALGSDLISPYALKKVLPRLVIGAIGMWLSWALVSTYIDIMNDLGRGVAGIMLSPFGEAKNFSLQNIAGIAGAATDGGNEQALFVGLATAGIISAGIFGLLGLGVTALMAFTVAIVILALRQAVIIFLIIIAPFAFAMSILPNTQKVWKMWSGTLNKLLLMFPMIMALLAAGKIFAFITAQSINDSNSPSERFFGFAISLIAYVAPYFFLPALFKAAGGLFNNLTGMVNNSGKGIFDKMRGGLDAKAKSRKAFKDQMSNEKLARTAAGSGPISSFARSRMRARGGQPITGGALSLRNRAATRQRISSSMDAAQDKLEQQQIEEEYSKLTRDGTLTKRDDLRKISMDRSASLVRRRAALAGMANTRDDEGIRLARDSMMSGSAEEQKAWGRAQVSKEIGEAFRDSATDITRNGAFSSGMSTGFLAKATKNTFKEATKEYREANALISGLQAGTISPASLNARQQHLAGEYLEKDGNGKVVFDATSYGKGATKLKTAVQATASAVRLSTTNETLKAEFKTPQATAARAMLNEIEYGVAGTPATATSPAIPPVAPALPGSIDAALLGNVNRAIDENTGLK